MKITEFPRVNKEKQSIDRYNKIEKDGIIHPKRKHLFDEVPGHI